MKSIWENQEVFEINSILNINIAKNVFHRHLHVQPITAVLKVLPTVSLRSCEYSKYNELFNDKIHYITMILYLNYKKNK